MSVSDIHRTIEAVWRIEAARVVASLARMLRDVGLAEELAQDALVAALEHWPKGGVPDNPAAWLMATAKHRAVDRLRREKLILRKHEEIGHDPDLLEAAHAADATEMLDDDIGDDLLRLVFTACHPVLSIEARVALTLRMLGGLTTGEIARAFLVPEATVAQRIVRAKRVLAEAKVPFELPRGDERAERLPAVLGVIYLIFNEGYAATAGEDWVRPQLCEDALRLGRVLAGLAPEEAEVHGLVALMEIQASRLHARTGADGEPVLLDCSPALGMLSLNALTAADRVLLPVSADYLSVEGAHRLNATLDVLEQRLDKRFQRRIVVTRFDARRRLSYDIFDILVTRFGDQVCETAIAETVTLAESPMHGKDIFSHAGASQGAADYMALTEELRTGNFFT